MSSPLDRTRHSKTTRAIASEQKPAAAANAAERLSYAEVLRRFAALLGEQLAREELANARTANFDDSRKG